MHDFTVNFSEDWIFMNQDDVKKYWNVRAKTHPLGQKTTMDQFLREIEYSTLRKLIQRAKPRSVLDVGCGDGVTTMRLARNFPEVSFVGIDYSNKMIESAGESSGALANIKFEVVDILSIDFNTQFDLIYTNRCLINLTSWELQAQAIHTMKKLLNQNGSLALIENILECQESFNRIRSKLKLERINIRQHNLFFQKLKLETLLTGEFKSFKIKNISSSYYILTRLVYSRVCKFMKREPNYTGLTHRFASRIPSLGNIGPVNIITAEL